MTMPFGKFKGQAVGDLPPDYLEWCLANVKDLNPWLRSAMSEAIAAAKFGERVDSAPPVVARVEQGLKGWYRRMSLKYHPDRGGSNEAQVVVNDCYESLCELIGEMGGDL
jgi:hypothetical protein